MTLDSDHSSTFPSYLYAVLTCALVFLIWSLGRLQARILFDKVRSQTYSQTNSSKITTDVEFRRQEKVDVCTSISCIRCSKSVYSVEKLLTKWKEIEQAFEPDENTRNKVKNGILDTSKVSKKYRSSQQEPTLFYLEGLPSRSWYNKQDYSTEVSILEKKCTLGIFEEEFMKVYENLDKGWVSNKVPSGEWHLFYFINQGVKDYRNCLQCPKVVETIEGLESAMLDCAFGNVMYSVLLPGTSIGRHCGPTNARIRCHVPLIAPKGYFISVAGEQRTWKKGDILIFDDSFYHEVYCHAGLNEPRVVLMIDLWHPSLLLKEREMIRKLFSPQLT
ncbi:aspartate beta-hydroxylase domain-containing protein 2-like [Dendronephthya gigantea]|uniref:aspartate beta-hydroxylase domain-containing protein 2-like n=1 Tax=Dendronephthya gigantea TaxID=151771 RepID=UPI0010692F11|nr:aspartate beta-hydroxylase domain-containing protein 2-like [Dendronephthya gigantea]